MRARSESEILSEIQQIYEQYRSEIPGKWTSWPNAIKVRVKELQALNISDARISINTYHGRQARD